MATPPLPPGFVLETANAGLPELPPGFELEGPAIQDLPAVRALPAEVGLSGVTREERQRQIAEMDAAHQSKVDSYNRTQQFGRAAGLTGRGMLRGLAAIADIVIDPVVGAVNRLGEKDANLSSLITGDRERYFPEQTNAAGVVDYFVNALGGPTPQTAGERIYSDTVGGVTGAAVPVGVGQQLARTGGQVAQNVGRALATQPGLQIASGATGSAAASTTREAGGGTGAQVAAGLLGGLTPAGITSGSQATVRGLIRGGEAGRQRVAQNIEDFRQAGTTPSVGQATERAVLRGAEQTASRLPGSASLMNARAQRQAEQIGEGLEATASQLSSRTTAGEAGRSVNRGVAKFIEDRRAVASQLYDDVDQFMPPATAVPLTNTQTALTRLTGLTPGAESTTAMLNNPRLTQIKNALGEDLLANQATTGQSTIPYEAVKELRSRVGRMLQGNELIADVPKAELKQLYGALSQDLEAAAAAAGPEAKRAVDRANNYWKSLQSRTEVLESAVNKNGGPEKVFNALWTSAKDGDTTLRAVMQSIPKEQQRDLAAAFVRRIGRANPGAQNADGDAFSAATFLTNWNRISPEAKKTVFNRFGPAFANDMDKIARVAANLREGSSTFANPSGTAAATAQIAGLTSFVTSLATGNAGLAAGIATGAGAANLWARAMTNPRFVAWLANQTTKPLGAIPAQATVLRGIAERNDEPELAEIADLIESSYQAQQKAPQN
jgi:hypothetical protein